MSDSSHAPLTDQSPAESPPAWIVTGPTSGIGRHIAVELAGRGTVVLVGRDPKKLEAVAAEIRGRRGRAVCVVADFSDITSVRRAATQIIALDLPLAGLVNNAGMMQAGDSRTAEGWDLVFATNHLGPFAFTEALQAHLLDGANVLFVCSSTENPTLRPAQVAGFRGGRYISAEASSRGVFEPGGAKRPSLDAYATSKQCNLATVLALARTTTRLRFTAIEPGFNPGSNLSRQSGAAVRFLGKYVLSPLAPFIKHWSTPERAGRVIARILTDSASTTGVYYDEKGVPMTGSTQVNEPAFQDRVVAETRALLAAALTGPTL